LEHANGMLTNALSELEDTHERMVDLVANIAALPYPESDKARSRLRLALAIGTELELDEEDLQHLKYAARLSKIGWVGVPRIITRKPFAAMTVEQRLLFEKHPSYAEAVLLSVPRLKQASHIIGFQHEKFNGQGFPQKSAGDGIPLGARILAVARDYYDLMAGGIEKNKLTPAEAVAWIVADAGAAYDPDIVKIFQEVVTTIDEFDPNVEEISVRSMSLLPNMRMARDLTTEEGVVLLSKGSTFTEDIIATLVNLEKRSDKELQIFVLKQEA
jgi:adenylate cyclase